MFRQGLVVVLTIAFAVQSHAGEPEEKQTPSPTIADLETRVKELAEENESLKSEISKLRARLGLPPQEKKPANVVQPVKGAPLAELMGKMPIELRPKPKIGWTKFDIPKVEAWLADNVVGQMVEFEVFFSDVVVVANKNNIALPWTVKLRFTLPDGPIGTVGDRYALTLKDQTLYPARGRHSHSWTFDCDEKLAKAIDSVHSAPIKVSATVSNAKFEAVTGRRTLEISVSDLTGLDSKLLARGAPKAR